MENSVLKYNKFILLTNVFLILISMVRNSQMFFIYLFYLFFSLIIYKNFSLNTKRYLYFTVLFYSIVTSGNSKFVFVFFFMYIITLLIQLKETKINLANLFDKNNRKYMIFFCIFIIYIFFSLFIAKDKALAFKTIYRYVIMICLFALMFGENRNKKNLNETLKFLLIIYMGILFLGLVDIVGLEYGTRNIFIDKGITYDYVKHIPTVFFYNPNNYAVVLDIGIALLFVKSMFSNDKMEKKLYHIIMAISIVQLIFSRSRIGWIVVFLIFVSFTVLGIILKIKKDDRSQFYIKQSLKGFFATLGIFFILALIPQMNPYFGKIGDLEVMKNIKESIFGEGGGVTTEVPPIKLEVGGEGSESERLTLIVNVVNGVVKEKNYLGFGAGNIGKYVKMKDNTYGITNIHSFWFEYLGDFGIFMFVYLIIIYCFMLLEFLKSIIKKESMQNTMFLLVSGIMVILAFSPSTVLMFSPFWLMLGMSFSVVTTKYIY